MESEIVTILEQIEDSGFNAYIIGGFVRDHLLGIITSDIDIVSNALPKDLMFILSYLNPKPSDYGTIKILTDKYRIDIATLRKEIKYVGRKPEEVEYIDSLEEDLLRRDFTINTIAMDKNGLILDKLNGLKDLQNKIIRSVLDPYQKLKEDPLRILRALRFAITLDFTLEDNLLNAIKKEKELLKTLPLTRIKEEIDKILLSDNVLNGFDFLDKLGILKILNINYDELNQVADISGMYAQIKVCDDYPFQKEEKRNIERIKNILKNDKITNDILFENGLYLCQVAGKIKGLDVEEITKSYHELPIKEEKDLDISSLEIMNILKIEPSSKVKDINNILIKKVLSKEINNDKKVLEKYLVENKEVLLK